MAMLKLTKNQLKIEQVRLNRLRKYLPTLQLKKALLQSEVERVRLEMEHLKQALAGEEERIERERSSLGESFGVSESDLTSVKEIQRKSENTAGVEVPVFEGVVFHSLHYSYFATPVWLEAWKEEVRKVAAIKAHLVLVEEKKKALEREWREVSIRVNLFEKVLIPRTQKNIRKIKVFLGDLELASVARAKVAKQKLIEGKSES